MKYLSTDQKYKRKLTVRILLTLLCGAALFLIAFTMISVVYDGGIYDKPKFHFATYGVCALIFAFITYKIGAIQLMLDRSWEGQITEIKHRVGYKTVSARAVRETMRSTVYYDITVITSGGKEKTVSYDNSDIHAEYYSVGMRVVHKRGSKYLISKEHRDGKVICPFCGNTLFDNTCGICKIHL